MTTTSDDRLKRLRMRSWRRGTKEMDLILGPFSDSELGRLSDSDLAALEALLEENDLDLYQWVSGKTRAPERHRAMLEKIVTFTEIRKIS